MLSIIDTNLFMISKPYSMPFNHGSRSFSLTETLGGGCESRETVPLNTLMKQADFNVKHNLNDINVHNMDSQTTYNFISLHLYKFKKYVRLFQSVYESFSKIKEVNNLVTWTL